MEDSVGSERGNRRTRLEAKYSFSGQKKRGNTELSESEKSYELQEPAVCAGLFETLN